VTLSTQDETEMLKGVLENELEVRVEERVGKQVEDEAPLTRSANSKQAT
jgi:hypothetical protein